jgi:hypothetical protein
MSETTSEAKRLLAKAGLPTQDPVPAPNASGRFPDGAHYRIEIPSTEGPASFRAVLAEAKARQVPVHRISQGTGIMLLTDKEIEEMVAIGAEHNIEVNLFIGPRATYDIGAQAYALAGKTVGLSLRGADQLQFALRDTVRAVRLGIRSLLVSDMGLLAVLGQLKQNGDLPSDLILKTSVMMPPCNPATARLMEQLGATTLNLPSDLTIPQLSAIRQATTAPIDFYVEAPDNVGGFIRYHEMAEIVRVTAPVYLKFGLKNSPDVYPSGSHIENTVIALSRERIRRAEMALNLMWREAPDLLMSPSPLSPGKKD